MSLADALVVLTTLPNADAAAALAKTIVEERLAACGNILPAVRSIYRWQGKTQDEPEVLVVLKTQRALFEPLRARIVQLHPYEVPEVIALPIAEGHQPYLDWIASETR